MRLPSGLVASGLLRAAEAMGGNGVMLARGDPDAGALIAVLTCRGTDALMFERRFDADDREQWNQLKRDEKLNSQRVAQLVAEMKRFDRDLWLIELDIPNVQRFIEDSLGET